MALPEIINYGKTRYTLVNGVYHGSDGSTKTPQEIDASQAVTPASPADSNAQDTSGNSNEAGGDETNTNPNRDINPDSLGATLSDQLKEFGDSATNNFSGFGNGILKYPTTINSGQDRILIQQVEYVTSGITGTSSINELTNLLSNRDSQFTTSKGYVILPVPNELSETNTTGWGESSLSSVAGSLMKTASTIAQEAASADLSGALGTLKSKASEVFGPNSVYGQRFMQYATANAGAAILKIGGINVDPEAYISRVTGTAVNPNLELLFSGPKLRQFGFTFKMTPRSADEAKQIRGIVKFFKKGMAPRRSTKEKNSIFLGTPNVFKVTFKAGSGGADGTGGNEIGGIGKIKTCALVSCAVNYTPDGFYASYDDSNAYSQPIATVISLGFIELTPIYNDDYDATDSNKAFNSIGPEGYNYTVDTTATQ